MNGGTGADTVSYPNRATGVWVSLATPSTANNGEMNPSCTPLQGCPAVERDTILSVDSVFGGSGDDILQGNENQNVIIGYRGNDVTSGGPGSDILVDSLSAEPTTTSSGTDTITGGSGADLLRGLQGDDTIYAKDPPSLENPNDVVDCGTGFDRGTADKSPPLRLDTLTGCESFPF
jgi:Ca2+-binding RTX toxin-like protein